MINIKTLTSSDAILLYVLLNLKILKNCWRWSGSKKSAEAIAAKNLEKKARVWMKNNENFNMHCHLVFSRLWCSKNKAQFLKRWMTYWAIRQVRPWEVFDRLHGPITHRAQGWFIGEMGFWCTSKFRPHHKVSMFLYFFPSFGQTYNHTSNLTTWSILELCIDGL